MGRLDITDAEDSLLHGQAMVEEWASENMRKFLQPLAVRELAKQLRPLPMKERTAILDEYPDLPENVRELLLSEN